MSLMKFKFNEKADSYLAALYNSVGATTAEQQYNTLMLKLGYEPGAVHFSHDPTWEQKASVLEYEILENEGLIQLVYA